MTVKIWRAQPESQGTSAGNRAETNFCIAYIHPWFFFFRRSSKSVERAQKSEDWINIYKTSPSPRKQHGAVNLAREKLPVSNSQWHLCYCSLDVPIRHKRCFRYIGVIQCGNLLNIPEAEEHGLTNVGCGPIDEVEDRANSQEQNDHSHPTGSPTRLSRVGTTYEQWQTLTPSALSGYR